MGATKKAKITFTLEHELREKLEVWAEVESRTLSNLIEMIVRKAYEQSHQEPAPAPAKTKAPPAAKAKRGKGSKES